MSAPPSIKPEPLTAKAFAPFGEVIETEGCDPISINEGTTKRFHELSQVDVGAAGRAIISVFRATRREMPIGIRMLECHPLGSQSFVPMSGREWLVVVAPPVSDRSGAGGERQGETEFSGKAPRRARLAAVAAVLADPTSQGFAAFWRAATRASPMGRACGITRCLFLKAGTSLSWLIEAGRRASRPTPISRSAGTRKAWPRSRCEVAALPADHACHIVGPCTPFPGHSCANHAHHNVGSRAPFPRHSRVANAAANRPCD